MAESETERIIDHTSIRDFAIAMRDKMDRKRAEGHGGWHDPAVCSVASLEWLLIEHIKKGDMVDIANFAMMIWNRKRSANG